MVENVTLQGRETSAPGCPAKALGEAEPGGSDATDAPGKAATGENTRASGPQGLRAHTAVPSQRGRCGSGADFRHLRTEATLAA